MIMVATEVRSDQLILPDGVAWGKEISNAVNEANNKLAALRKNLGSGFAIDIPNANPPNVAGVIDVSTGTGSHSDLYGQQLQSLVAQQYAYALGETAVKQRIFEAVNPITAAARFINFAIFSFNKDAAILADNALAASKAQAATPNSDDLPPQGVDVSRQLTPALTAALQGTIADSRQVVAWAARQAQLQAGYIGPRAGYPYGQYVPGAGYQVNGGAGPGSGDGRSFVQQMQQIAERRKAVEAYYAQQQQQQQAAANAAAQQEAQRQQQAAQAQGAQDGDDEPPEHSRGEGGPDVGTLLALQAMRNQQNQAQNHPHHHHDDDHDDQDNDKPDDKDGKQELAQNDAGPGAVQPGPNGAPGAGPPGAPAGTLQMPSGPVAVASLPEPAQRAVLAAQKGESPYPALDKLAREDPSQIGSGAVAGIGDPNDPKHAKQYVIVVDPKDGGTPCVVLPNNATTPLKDFLAQNGDRFLGIFAPPGEGSPQPGGPQEQGGIMDQPAPATTPVGRRDDRVVV